VPPRVRAEGANQPRALRPDQPGRALSGSRPGRRVCRGAFEPEQAGTEPALSGRRVGGPERRCRRRDALDGRTEPRGSRAAELTRPAPLLDEPAADASPWGLHRRAPFGRMHDARGRTGVELGGGVRRETDERTLRQRRSPGDSYEEGQGGQVQSGAVPPHRCVRFGPLREPTAGRPPLEADDQSSGCCSCCEVVAGVARIQTVPLTGRA